MTEAELETSRQDVLVEVVIKSNDKALVQASTSMLHTKLLLIFRRWWLACDDHSVAVLVAD